MYNKPSSYRNKLITAAKAIALAHTDYLDKMKAEHVQLNRPDFLWHYLLQSFATMGKASGWKGLIGTPGNYNRLRYEVLKRLDDQSRALQVERICREAGICMPPTKAKYILSCFKQVQGLGGPEAAKKALLSKQGRDAKIRFLKTFHGIGDKYARNIMMDVYHEDFRDSIAIDARIKSLSKQWGLEFSSYQEQERYYLSVAAEAGLNGWELDRLMFKFQSEFLAKVR